MEENSNDILTYAKARIENLESQLPKATIKDYYRLEEELLSKSKSLKTIDHLLKYNIYILLYNSFFKVIDDSKTEMDKTIKRLFYFYFFSFSSNENRSRLYMTNSNTKELRIYKQKRREIRGTIWDECIKHILTNYSTVDVIPNFLLFQEKRLVRYKTDINLEKHFNYPIDSIITYENPTFAFLFNAFQDFFDGKTNLFDKAVFNENDKILCFGALAMCNHKYINQRDQNKKIFLNNLKKYITILGLQHKTKELVQKIIQLTTDKKYDFDGEKKKVIDKLLEIKTKNNEKFLLIVFSFSCLLNSFLIETENSEKKEIMFTSKLKCSAKERQFLINILKEVDALDINYILETFVFQKLIKSYTKCLFDENNKAKILLKYQFIVDSISKVGAKDSDPNDTVLNEIEAKVFSSLFEKFKKDKEGIFSTEEENFLTTFTVTPNSQETFLFNLQALYINNQHPYRTSTHACICIDGNFTNKVCYYRNIPSASLITNSNTTNADFYQFSWQNEKNYFKLPPENNENVIERESAVNKAIAKFFGKFLAYIIASRAIFKFQSISLMGFSLGCHVIKHCLLELNKISGKIDTDDIIKDIIFIGGTTVIDKDKYPNIFSNVAGNVVNVYNENDTMLRSVSNNAIGLKQLKMAYDNEIDSIINVDQSHHPLMIQDEYKGNFAKLMAELVTLY